MFYRCSTLLLSAALTFQGVALAQQATADAGGLPSVPMATLQAAGDLLAGKLLVDEPRPGEVWARGDDYKASFTTDGATFYPFFGSETPRHYPVHFASPDVRLDGEAVATTAATPSHDGSRVSFARGGFIERYLLTTSGIEQTFVFDELARRGELSLRIPVSTDLQPRTEGEGLRFEGQFGEVTYSQAVAIDAEGTRLPLHTWWTGEGIEIRVPSSFVAEATLPLVIDPLIGNNPATVTGPVGIGNPDLAFDHQTESYLLVYDQPYSATDHDVFAFRLRGDLMLLGTAVTIDYTTDNWMLPRVANHRVAQQFLVVAEVHSSSSFDIYIAGRTVDVPAATTGSQFDIARASVTGHASGDKFRPDVGGGAAGSATPLDTYLVVWEREYAQFDHDIHARHVRVDSTLVGASPLYLANSNLYDAKPSISKSNVHSDRWHICYQRQLFGSTSDWNILGARILWDGTVLGTDEAIAGNVQFQGNCAVSSPSVLPGNPVFVAYENRITITGEPNIEIVQVDSLGTPSSRYHLTAYEAIALGTTSFMTFDQVRPSVATDGARCVVSYREINTVTNSYDTFVTLVGVDPTGAVSIQEPRVPVGSYPYGAWIDEVPAPICSRWDAAHERVRYDVAYEFEDVASSTFGVNVRGYLGFAPGGGFSTRATGCGNLAIQPYGVPAYGAHIQFELTNATGLPGFIVGTPAFYTFGICPQCAIGVDGSTVFGVNVLGIDLPPSMHFMGMTFSVQGFDILTSGGVCLGQFIGSETIDFQIQ